VQKIGQADIGRLIGQESVVGDSTIVITDPRPDNFTFTFTVKYQKEYGFRRDGSWGQGQRGGVTEKVSAKILKEGIEIGVPGEKNRGPIDTFNPNDTALTLEWTNYYQVMVEHCSFGGSNKYEDKSRHLKIENLNLRAIVMGLLNYVVDNSYLLG
jgi:hypothetical protein